MDFVSLLAAVSTLFAAAVGLLQAVVQHRYRESTEHALAEARKPKVGQALRQGDLKGLGDYFFSTLGRLPLADYAEDAESRRVVSEAVRNVEAFIRADRSSISDDSEALVQVDERRAEDEIAMGDLWAGLSRLRRRIELALRKAAKTADIPVMRMGPGQLLRRLVAEEIVPKSAARPLHRAIAICNRGVHGDYVSPEEAEEALALAADGLANIERE